MAKKQTFGLIVGNRGFFPGHLAEEGRDEMIKVIKKAGYDVVCLTTNDTKHGAVESREEINKCAQLFRKNADRISGIIVTLPNFGDERAIADSIDLAGLGVPVLVQAYPDDLQKMNIANRRDSFCGKISACNNLRQKGIPFTLTDDHTVSPGSDAFAAELEAFAAVCRVVEGLDRVRIGAVGARPAPFTTVRYSEKLLEESGISIETLDLSEVFGMAGCRRQGETRCDKRIRENHRRAGGLTREDGKARRCARTLDGRKRTCDSMLDFNRGILRCGSLHRNEHDEREVDAERLRGRRYRRCRDVRALACFEETRCPARLE